MKTMLTVFTLTLSTQSFAAKVNEAGVQVLQMFSENSAGLKTWKSKHKNFGPVINDAAVRKISEVVTDRYQDGEARRWLTKYEYVINSDDALGTDEIAGSVKWTVVESVDSEEYGWSSTFKNKFKTDYNKK